MKKTVFGRSAKLLGMASKLAKSELGHKIRKQVVSRVEDVAPDLLATRLRQAQILTQNLSQLKGAAMKAGQLISIDSSDLLPPEVIEVLSELQSSADPIEFAILDEILREEIDPQFYGGLEDLDVKAYAAASIGQVHRAHYKGQYIVLKIQYPGVVESIDSDLKILKKVVQGMIKFSGRKMEMDELFNELSIILHQEADYKREKEHLKKFSDLLKPFPSYVVPEPIEELSANKVLAMTYVEGLGLREWLKTDPPKESMETIGKLVLDLYCKEFFEWGIVQTDPNYGNFKILQDPLRLVLLDFGATVEYTDEFRAGYVQLLKDFASFDRVKMLKSAMDFGLLDDRESDETKALFVDFLMSAVEPFLPHLQPFQFNDKRYSKKAEMLGREFTSSLKYSPPPRQLIFLHRKLGGIFQLLRKMEVQLDLIPYWKKMVGEDFQVEKIEVPAPV